MLRIFTDRIASLSIFPAQNMNSTKFQCTYFCIMPINSLNDAGLGLQLGALMWDQNCLTYRDLTVYEMTSGQWCQTYINLQKMPEIQN